jgi:hypothetical protein
VSYCEKNSSTVRESEYSAVYSDEDYAIKEYKILDGKH